MTRKTTKFDTLKITPEAPHAFATPQIRMKITPTEAPTKATEAPTKAPPQAAPKTAPKAGPVGEVTLSGNRRVTY